jgi:2-hydroxychromene-2-carboxylate isomerase
MPQATFYFDIGSPFAYLAAERIADVLSSPVSMQPVSLGALFKLTGRSSWALGNPEQRQTGMAEVERRALAHGLPPVRWPDPWPGNYLMAMRALTFAHIQGSAREFALHAFRDAFQQGHDLSLPTCVLRVAGRLGLDPQEVDDATRRPEIKLALRQATEVAYEIGVFGVPTIEIDGELFWGDDRLEDAASRLRRINAEK